MVLQVFGSGTAPCDGESRGSLPRGAMLATLQGRGAVGSGWHHGRQGLSPMLRCVSAAHMSQSQVRAIASLWAGMGSVYDLAAAWSTINCHQAMS